MKYTRKILAVLLSILMLALCMPFAFAKTIDGFDGGIHWVYDNATDELTLSVSNNGDGSMRNIAPGSYPD